MSTTQTKAMLNEKSASSYVNFRSRRLSEAFTSMRVEVECLARSSWERDDAEPTLRGRTVEVTEHELRPHVWKALESQISAAGNQVESNARLSSTRVDHVYWVGAILLRDEVASQAWLNLLQGKVARQLRNRFGPSPHVEQVLDDLPSRLLSPGKSSQPRLASYRGESSLASWMTGIAIRQTINELRQRKTMPLDQQEEESRLFELASYRNSPNLDQQAAGFLERLLMEIMNTVRHLNSREWLVFHLLYFSSLSPSETAEYLGLSRPRISQCISSIHRRIARQAARLITQLAGATEISEQSISRLLRNLLDNLRKSDSPVWQRLAERHGIVVGRLPNQVGIAGLPE